MATTKRKPVAPDVSKLTVVFSDKAATPEQMADAAQLVRELCAPYLRKAKRAKGRAA